MRFSSTRDPMQLQFWHRLAAFSLALASLAVGSSAQVATPKDDTAWFQERPGQLEFSGWMIVRPLMEPKSHARAVDRLRDHLIEYVPQTEEYIISLPPGHDENSYARWLMSTGDYQYAEPDWWCFPTQRIPNDASYGQQWHHAKMNSPLAWDVETGKAGTIVAIVDSGMQLDHPDLVGRLVSGYNADDDLAQSAGGDVSDVDGHGTFVSGLAGATGNNGGFVTGMG